MLFKSTRPSSPVGTRRLPSSSTMLRTEPRPRRSTNDEPPLPLLTAEPIDGTTPGSSRRTSSATFDCLSSIASDVVTLTGVDCSRFGLRIRVPVTTISSPSAWASWVAASWVVVPGACASVDVFSAGGASCAKAGAAYAIPAIMVVASNEDLKYLFDIVFPLQSALRRIEHAITQSACRQMLLFLG